jgi:hypothetical protein
MLWKSLLSGVALVAMVAVAGACDGARAQYFTTPQANGGYIMSGPGGISSATPMGNGGYIISGPGGISTITPMGPPQPQPQPVYPQVIGPGSPPQPLFPGGQIIGPNTAGCRQLGLGCR